MGTPDAFIVDRFNALTVEDEAVVLQCLVNLRHKLHDITTPLHLHVINFINVSPVAPCVLRGVTRRIRRAQDRRHTLHLVVDGDHATTRGQGKLLVFPIKPVRLDGIALGLQDSEAIFAITAFDQNAVFVPAQTRQHKPVRVQLILQQIGEFRQQLVATLVPTGIVDHLELIKVDVRNHVRYFVLLGDTEGPAQLTLEFLAIDKPGQLIVGCLMRQLVVHVLQHAVRRTVRQRDVRLFKYLRRPRFEHVGKFFNHQLMGFDASPAYHDETGDIIVGHAMIAIRLSSAVALISSHSPTCSRLAGSRQKA